MRFLFLIFILVFTIAATAQVKKIKITASGLTCSLCSNAIYKALKSLAAVGEVKPDLNNSSFDISVRPNAEIDFDAFKKKVQDAGFSVSSFLLDINFSNQRADDRGYVTDGSHFFRLQNKSNEILNGVKQIKLIDKGFVTAKEYKQRKTDVANSPGKKIYNAIVL